MFRDYAERGKSIMGWCFGFKLHLICNERGELLNFIPNRIRTSLCRTTQRNPNDLGLMESYLEWHPKYEPPYAEPHVRCCERSVNTKIGDKHL